MNALQQLLEIIGGVVVAGGGIGFIVYQIFKHLAAKWLDAKFEERLQDLKHRHGQEIEQLRFKISALLDRTTKLHQREFEVLPEAWSRLNDAFWNVRGFVSALQSYPDINRMLQPQQEEFINSSPLQEWQKTELRTAHDKTKLYQQQIFWHRLSDAQSKTRDAYSYLIKNGIFIKEDIRQKFSAIHDLIWNALTEHQLNEEHEIRPRERTDIGRFTAEGETLMKELERDIHVRLWPEDGAELSVGFNRVTKRMESDPI